MSKRKKLLIVEDDPAQRRLMQEHLADGEHEILLASTGKEALQIVLSEEPRIIIADWKMPEMNGRELCKALRQHEGVRFAYIIVVTAHTSEETLIQAFDAGANDFICKPVDREVFRARLRAADRIVCLESDLAKRTRELHRVNAEMALAHEKLCQVNELLQRMATTDELTNLLNRREAINRLDDLWANYERYHRQFSAIILDIDHFKLFNDTYGHDVGDIVLRETADVLMKNCRRTDLVCRIGGEEFLILCPNVDLTGGMTCAEHLRSAVEQHVTDYKGKRLEIRISLGITEASPGMNKAEEMLRYADKALYEAKRSGRNRVCIAVPPVAEAAV